MWKYIINIKITIHVNKQKYVMIIDNRSKQIMIILILKIEVNSIEEKFVNT